MERLKAGTPVVVGTIDESSPPEPIGYGIGWAVKTMRNGQKVRRRGWNGKGMFIVLMPELQLAPYSQQDTAKRVNDRTAKWIGEDQPLNCRPYIAMYNAQKEWQPGWVCSQSDLLAADWEVAVTPTLHDPGAPHISTKSTELDSH